MKIKLQMALFVLILAFFCFLAAHPFPPELVIPNNDSYVYVQYAKFIVDHGPVAGFQKLVNLYASSEEYRFYPAPFRVGYIGLAALGLKVLGEPLPVLFALSFVPYLLLLAVSFHFCRKHFGADTAFYLFVLMAASPLMLQMSHVFLPESAVNFLWGAALWMFFDYLKSPRNAIYWSLIASCTAALLIKESSFILMFFFLVVWCVYRRSHASAIAPGKIAGLIAAPPILAGVIWMSILGADGFLKVSQAFYSTHFVDGTNDYAILYSSGPWFRYIVDFILLSPLTTIAFIAYTGFVLLARRLEWEEAYFLIYFGLIYTVFSLPAHSKVVRFVTNLDMVMCLFTVFLVAHICQRYKRRVYLIFTVILLLFVINVESFMTHIFQVNMLDPITHNLAHSRNMVMHCKPQEVSK